MVLKSYCDAQTVAILAVMTQLNFENGAEAGAGDTAEQTA